MLAHVDALAVLGVDAYIVHVEVDVSTSFVAFSLVGLPDAAVRESGDRVRSAIRNSGFSWPQRRITINLAPADTKKQGSTFDLPIAIGILIGGEEIKPCGLTNYAAVGELGLNGEVRPVTGALPMAIGARDAGKTALLIPKANASEVAVVDGIDIYPIESLTDAVDLVVGLQREPMPLVQSFQSLTSPRSDVDWSDVKGQESVKRALEVAAAGGHNVILVGSPGSGKTLLARRLSTILPPLLLKEALEVTKLYSVAGLLNAGEGLVTQRPFRSPHHTVSHAGLVGGGSFPRPGEISLAHNGVLFLDELPEFQRNVLEVMRQPLEDGYVSIARAAQKLTFPAHFQLVAAMNPSPCGLSPGDLKAPGGKICTCSPIQVQRYLSRISGPLLDRIDLHIEVPRLSPDELMAKRAGESSATVRARVCAAREWQVARMQDDGITSNARMRTKQLREYCELDGASSELLKAAIHQFGLSARAYDRILKVARTIADLEAAESIQMHHVAEAINYRALDRKLVG